MVRYLLTIGLIVAAWNCATATHAGQVPKKQRPNFIVILADDLGYGDLSVYDGWIKTPHLQRLANGGMKLTDFHSSGAVCSPTRAGLMTGRYQQRAGIPGVVFADAKRPSHDDGLQQSETTFAELLRQAGYATGVFGKWHLGYYPQYNPIRHGFDRFNGYVSGNIDFFSHVDQAGRFDWWRQDVKKDEKGYVTHLITKHAVEFITKNKNRPFCLYIPHEAPHYPYQGPNDKAVRKVGQARTKAELKMSAAQKKRAYREMVEEMDNSVGAVMATLRKHGLEENTFVLFFSDNGATRIGSNGMLRGFKGSLWEGGHRVPAIAYWPGRIPAGSTNHSLCISIDVMPTLLSLAGKISVKNRKLDGRDLSDVLLKNTTVKNRKLFWQHGKSMAMRDGPWVFVRQAKKVKGDQLFNLAKDLGQKNNLARQQPQRVERMRTELNRWYDDVRTGATKQPVK